MSKEVNQAARITGPIAVSDTTNLLGVVRFAVSAVRVDQALPTDPVGAESHRKNALGGRFVRALAVGCNVQWAQGRGSAPAITFNALNNFGSGSAVAGGTLVNGVPEPIIVDSQSTHMSFICDAGQSGYVEFYVSDQAVP